MFDRLIVMEETALEEQSGRYQSAISSVLKADSNLYQAKVAELNLLNQIGDVLLNIKFMGIKSKKQAIESKNILSSCQLTLKFKMNLVI